MFEFLFDIKPETGNVRSTIRLACLISERGNKVYYTDTSDSVFTSGLLKKGVGRVIYSNDFRWFTPDLALLDCQLQEKEQVYNQYGIDYLFITIHKTDSKIDFNTEMPVINLPPAPCKIAPQSSIHEDLIDKLTEIKENRARTVIIGLLEEKGSNMPHIETFYKTIKKSGNENPQYQFIILTNHGETETGAFSLPGNVAIYRLPDLHTLLPLCDMALTDGDMNYWIECTFAHVPMANFTPGEVKGITPRKLDRRIKDILNNRTHIIEQQKYLCDFFERENKRLDETADWLINRIKQKKRL